MEVRNELVDRADLVRRPNEDAGVGRFLPKEPIVADCALQSTDAGRADRPDLSATGSRVVQNFRRARGERVRLLVHDVIGGVLRLDRLEGAGADLKEKIGPADFLWGGGGRGLLGGQGD